MKLYILYLNSVYVDMDIHYYSDVLGVFSSIEKDKKAYETFIVDYLDDDGVFHWDHADEWSFVVCEYELDNRGNGVRIEELANGEED